MAAVGGRDRLEELTERATRNVCAPASGTAAPPPIRTGANDPIILGIDPGTATMGYGLVRVHAGGVYTPVDYGVFETLPDKPMPRRLLALYDDLTGLLQRYQPTHAVVERLFFGRNVTTALTVGQARGVALLAIAQAGLDVAEYTPAEIKYALSSYGKATKSDIQRMTQMLLHLHDVPKPDDAADALAVALCHAHSLRARALGIR